MAISRHLCCISVIAPMVFLFHSFAFAQFNTFDDDFLSGFSEDGRIKILLLNLAPSGMTETAAQQIVRALQQNLSNTNHFTVVGPSEWNAQLQARDPNLAVCDDIACGIQIGKLFSADKVLVGQISAEPILDENAEEVDGFVLSIRLLDVLINTLDFSDEVHFTDQDMQDELFQLAVRISENTLLRGRVLSVRQRNVVVDLGRAHGLRVGDQMVVYSQNTTTTDLEGQTIGLEQKNLTLLEVSRLNDMTSETIMPYRFDSPESGDLVKTYINRRKQVRLVSDARRELDTRKRLAPRTQQAPVVLEPEVIDSITGEPVNAAKQEWRQRVIAANRNRQFWMWMAIGTGVGTVALLTNQVNLGDDLQQLSVVAAGAVTGYSAYRYFQARNDVNALQAEGRVKGFISWQYQFDLPNKGVQVALKYNF